ncbi:arginine deiminase-related protein [Niabella sp. W65]|nr:arginine deiminase-related protein [Niabella sp. W65]MCH7367706.1 arginine deiminase-related protein [Niabella sp. W65]
MQEFDNFVHVLSVYGIKVTVIQDTREPHTPDSVFPNNWISFHEDGTVVLYPMFAENRKLERNKNIVEKLNETFFIRTTIDLTNYEQKNAFLEGTGSMVLDRDNEIAYACLSPRTNASVLYDFATLRATALYCSMPLMKMEKRSIIPTS